MSVTRAVPPALARASAAPASADPVPVTLTDMGFSTPCAEMDNVLVSLTGPTVRRFTVTARHSAYEAGVTDPVSAPDFTNCVFPAEPIRDFDRQTHLLWQDGRMKLFGHRLSKSRRAGALTHVRFRLPRDASGAFIPQPPRRRAVRPARRIRSATGFA